MNDEEKKLAESVISESWMNDFDQSNAALNSSGDEIYRLGLECAQLRSKLAEAERAAEMWEDFHSMETEKHHAWVAWARAHGAVATGPDAEPEARRMLDARLVNDGPTAKKGEE